MKKFCLLSLMMTVPVSAFATQEFVCGSRFGENMYQVRFDTNYGGATVTRYNKAVDTLDCIGTTLTVGVIAKCYSIYAENGGFSVDLYRAENESLTANLYKESTIRSKLIESLPCG